jgi:hypothetical protein
MLGSIVQNGKLALCAFALESELNKVDFPTLGKPTIPAFILSNLQILKAAKLQFFMHISFGLSESNLRQFSSDFDAAKLK